MLKIIPIQPKNSEILSRTTINAAGQGI